MMLTSEEMQQIVVDKVSGRKQRVVGEEADSFRLLLDKDIQLAEKKKWIIEVTPEWEVDTEGSL